MSVVVGLATVYEISEIVYAALLIALLRNYPATPWALRVSEGDSPNRSLVFRRKFSQLGNVHPYFSAVKQINDCAVGQGGVVHKRVPVQGAGTGNLDFMRAKNIGDGGVYRLEIPDLMQ